MTIIVKQAFVILISGIINYISCKNQPNPKESSIFYKNIHDHHNKFNYEDSNQANPNYSLTNQSNQINLIYFEDSLLSSENHEDQDVVILSDVMDIGGSKTLKFDTLNTCGVLSKFFCY